MKFKTATNKTGLTITGSSPKASGVLVIPSTINGLPVTEIGVWAFRGCTALKTVTLPDSLTPVDDWAFNGCKVTGG